MSRIKTVETKDDGATKELITLTIKSIKQVVYKYPKFKFNFSSLKDFLSGKESKTIISFKISNL